MKGSNHRQIFILICGLTVLVGGGCLFKSARVPARHFILTAVPPPGNALAATSRAPAIEVGFVKMPSYLLRESMVIRKSASEIEVLDDAVWAEQLDEGFRRVLQENLSSASDQAQLSATGRNEATLRLSVDVEQFDVDAQGQGTLLANWRITEPGASKPMKSGQAHLTKSGPPPRGNPQAVATTLSALIGEFSGELAAASQQATQPKP